MSFMPISRRLMIRTLSLLCLLAVGWITPAGATVPALPELPVRGHVLVDFHSGRVLTENNSRERMEPASITKLMSAYLFYQRLENGQLSLDEMVPVSRNAYGTIGSRMFIEVGSQVSVEDLLRGIVIQSGNDATVALAEYVAGSEAAFAQMMNETAAQLGLRDSHFVNSTGLPDPQHYTTAEDIARLARALIKHFTQYYELYSERRFTFNEIEQHNRNRLLWRDESVDGLKTGHTSSAGYCLASSARRGEMRLIAVVLGAERENDRFEASQQLLNYGFGHYETFKLYTAEQALTEVRLWKGENSALPLGFTEDIFITIPKGRYDDMQAALRINAHVEAPVRRGDELGSVLIRLDREEVTSIPLVALQDVAPAGWLGRLTDRMLMMISGLFN